MKTIYQLILQYKSDVETRIACIKEQWDNADIAVQLSEDCMDDYENEIAHWKATLEQINETIENDDNFEID